jgi:hypothetical protein
MYRPVWTLLIMAILTGLASATPPNPQPKNNGKGVAPVTSPAPAPRRPPPPPIMPQMVTKPTQPMVPYDSVIYVLDISCSMSDDLDDAIRATDCFFSDDFKAAVVTFNDSHLRWSGVKVKCLHKPLVKCGRSCLPAGWCRLPLHRKEMMAYLNSCEATGGTSPVSAIEYVYKNAPPSTLIVFISDGAFHEPFSTAAAKAGVAWRKKKKLDPVQVLVWSTSENAKEQKALVELAKVGGGGLWKASKPRER